jgi:hypothetical protein
MLGKVGARIPANESAYAKLIARGSLFSNACSSSLWRLLFGLRIYFFIFFQIDIIFLVKLPNRSEPETWLPVVAETGVYWGS